MRKLAEKLRLFSIGFALVIVMVWLVALTGAVFLMNPDQCDRVEVSDTHIHRIAYGISVEKFEIPEIGINRENLNCKTFHVAKTYTNSRQ